MDDYNSSDFTATYSPEDDKLRLYAAVRIDDETYSHMKQIGFKWAPKQELFFSFWSPNAEDFCVDIAGEIEAEELTLIERAAAKAERLENLSGKRAKEADIYSRTANRISERFAYGQPILVGHHSERRARKDKARMESAMRASVDANNAVYYWNYRAEGVERHANRKANAGVRARRIDRLWSDLRNYQRDLNHAEKCLLVFAELLENSDKDGFAKTVEYYVGARLKSGSMAPQYREYKDGIWYRVEEGILSHIDAVKICIEHHKRQLANPITSRWIAHTLNRLSYERAELGEVPRFEGTLTATLLQVFARSNGADKPEAVKTEGGYRLKSRVSLPLHLSDSDTLELSDDGWRDLMRDTGYAVPDKKHAKPPILNFKAQWIASAMYGQVNQHPQIEMTKADYTKAHADYRAIRLSQCGSFRYRVITQHGGKLRAVYIVDMSDHEAPQSDAYASPQEATADAS